MKPGVIRPCLAGLLLLATLAQAGNRDRPNIILMLADDLGWMDLGCQGSTFYKTPNIDRLASEGTRFTDAYAFSSCSPTRASIMTGKTPPRHRISNPLADWRAGPVSPRERAKDWPWNEYVEPVPPLGLGLDEITVAERLQAAGYDTGIVGKWHLGGEGFEPTRQGFGFSVAAGEYPHPKSYFSPYRMEDVIADGPAGEYLTDRKADEAIRFIRKPRQAPFFLYMAFYTPHTPIQGKPEKIARYQKTADPSHPQNNPEYAAMVESLDENVGRILDALKAAGLDRNTVVVFASDNGGVVRSFGGNEKITSNLPLRMGKGTLWEGGIRVPLIVRWPGVAAPGSVCSEPVWAEDYYPTFCEIAGAPVATGEHAELDGLSMVPLFRKPDGQLDRQVLCWRYYHYNDFTGPCEAIRKGELKLIRFYGGPTMLFNLKDDIGESNDLSAQYPEVVKDLTARLDGWFERVGAWEMVQNPAYDPQVRQPGLYPGFDPAQDGASLVAEWNFEGKTTDGWTALKKCTLAVRDGALVVSSQGFAASIDAPAALKQPGTYVLQAKVREKGIDKGACALFWKQRSQKEYDNLQRVQFALPHDEGEHTVAALFRVKKPADSIRLDPAMMAGEVRFDWIRIYRTELP